MENPYSATTERGSRTGPLTHPESTASVVPMLNHDTVDAYCNGVVKAAEKVARQLTSTDRPFTGISPEALSERFRNLDPGSPLSSLDAALEELHELYLEDAVHFHHPRYMAHLNCPVTLASSVAEVIQSGLNTAVETWDQSAGATLIEQTLVDWTARRIGLGNRADGVFTSGGTQSNLMALLLARDQLCTQHWNHDTRQHGLPREASRLRIFCSEASHFSVQKAAALMGLGYDAVIPVPCDGYFRMDTDALAALLDETHEQGLAPMAVVATAGTTDFGSIDPLAPITQLCREYDLWCHVDAAYGCGLLASPRHRHLLDGIEHADSVTVDYHKAFFQPVSCSACVVRERSHLGYLTWHADYLNPLEDQAGGTPNLVDKSLQTTRRFDALKLWLSLRTMGADGIGEAFDQTLHLARQAYLLLLSDDDIEVLHQPQLGALVFRYRPNRWLPDALLDDVNQRIREALMASGEALIATTRVKGHRYLKFTLLDPSTRIQDIQAVLKVIRKQGQRALTPNHSTQDSRESAHA